MELRVLVLRVWELGVFRALEPGLGGLVVFGVFGLTIRVLGLWALGFWRFGFWGLGASRPGTRKGRKEIREKTCTCAKGATPHEKDDMRSRGRDRIQACKAQGGHLRSGP